MVNGPASRVARSPSAARVSEIDPWTLSAANTSSVSLVAIACWTAGSSASGATVATYRSVFRTVRAPHTAGTLTVKTMTARMTRIGVRIRRTR